MTNEFGLKVPSTPKDSSLRLMYMWTESVKVTRVRIKRLL